MKFKRSKALLLCVALGVSLLAGCGAEKTDQTAAETAESSEAGETEESGTGQEAAETAEEPVTISFWHTYCGSYIAADEVAALLEKFQKDNPNITLEIEEVNSEQNSIGQRIRTAMAADDIPDVWTIWGGASIIDYVNNDKLMDMQEYLDRSTELKYEDINETAWDYYTFDGVLHGIPCKSDYSAWFCNTELFEQYGLELPKTMQDVMDCAEVFNANGIVPLAVGCSGGNPGHFLISEMTHQYEGGHEAIATFGDTNNIDNEPTRKGVQLICDLKNAGVFPSDTIANGDWGPSFELYNSGKAAMIYTYSSSYGTMSDEMYAKSQQINVPKAVDADVDPADYVISVANYGFVASKEGWEESEAKKAAMVKFFDFLTSDEFVETLATAGAIPVKITDIQTSNEIVNDVVAFHEGKEHVSSFSHTTLHSGGWQEFKMRADELFAGSIDADEFITSVQEAYNE